MTSDGYRAFVGGMPVRRHAINCIRQMLAELGEKILLPHARLARHSLDPVVAENAPKLVRRNRCVRPIADPRLHDMPKPRLLEGSHQRAQTAHSSSFCAAQFLRRRTTLARSALITAQQVHKHALHRGSAGSAQQTAHYLI